jgi:UDP-glucose 4-epimerase
MEGKLALNNSRIFITGGAGFIGVHTARALAERDLRVFLLDIRDPDPELQWLLHPVRDRVTVLKGNVTDLPVLLHALRKEKITHLVHTAAATDLEVLIHQPCTAQKIMVEGQMNVLEAARFTGLQRIVFTSTIAVYTPKQYEPIDEKHPVHLPNEAPTLASYSTFKLAAESIGLFYWAYHGVDFIALRLSAVYGLGMRYPMYIKPMVENSVRGLETVFPAGREMRRDYTYVKDVVSGIVLALEASGPFSGRIFNISSGDPLRSAFEVAEIVKNHVPGARIEIGEGLSDLEARDLRSRGRLSIVRAQEELGFKPRFGLEDGIPEYIQEFRNYSGLQKKD